MGMLLWTALEQLFKILRRWIRRSRLARYAASHGCSFYTEDVGNTIPFSGNIFSQEPSNEYQYSKAANIIQGSMHGLRFTYFEKTLIVSAGYSAKEPVATRSIVAIDSSASEHFESGEAVDKDLTFYRENGGICFWWNDPNSTANAIPVEKLGQWLDDIANTFHAGVSKAGIHP